MLNPNKILMDYTHRESCLSKVGLASLPRAHYSHSSELCQSALYVRVSLGQL